MNTKDLCAWLRANSSGVYRPAADAADELERMRIALLKIALLDPATDSEEGHNEWGEADCFNQAQAVAREASLHATGEEMADLKTVGDYLKALSEFPEDWQVKVATPAGGGVAVEPREIGGAPVVAIFGSNGGRFGENPLTDKEYDDKSKRFLGLKRMGYEYTSIHGDHRLYRRSGQNDTCYGTHFDRRIIERMVAEGLVPANEVDIERVRRCDAQRCR